MGKNSLVPATAFTYFPIYIAHIVHLYLIILLKFEKKKICSWIDTSLPPPHPTQSIHYVRACLKRASSWWCLFLKDGGGRERETGRSGEGGGRGKGFTNFFFLRGVFLIYRVEGAGRRKERKKEGKKHLNSMSIHINCYQSGLWTVRLAKNAWKSTWDGAMRNAGICVRGQMIWTCTRQ